MALAHEDIQFIKDHLGQWLTEQSLGKPPAVYEIELRERMVRVEEELRHQRELIKTLIEQMDKRFDQVDKRFEQVDKRFEELNRRMDRFMIWSFSTTLTVGGLVVAALKLLRRWRHRY
jgi:predicted RNase H-like nuclease (RuvC/YqgF family)